MLFSTIQDPAREVRRNMRKSAPTFSQLVCSEEPVQTAFACHPPARFWWRLILLLHGKPVSASLAPERRTQVIADGFKFYAALYRCLGVLLLLAGTALYSLDRAGDTQNLGYWAAVSGLAGTYLWFASGLGYSGARIYRDGQAQGASTLIAFMVMIVALLSLFMAAMSVAAEAVTGFPVTFNLATSSGLFVFGVGSYLIEILYLATERPSRQVPG